MSTKIEIHIIHGPNLNLLGTREPEHYGSATLEELDSRIIACAESRGAKAVCFQSNHEGAIIDYIHGLRGTAHGIVINPAAYTHTSIAIRDAISAAGLPAVEVHLSDISKREKFRRVSMIKDVCIGQISGLGADSYLRGIDMLVEYLKK